MEPKFKAGDRVRIRPHRVGAGETRIVESVTFGGLVREQGYSGLFVPSCYELVEPAPQPSELDVAIAECEAALAKVKALLTKGATL